MVKRIAAALITGLLVLLSTVHLGARFTIGLVYGGVFHTGSLSTVQTFTLSGTTGGNLMIVYPMGNSGGGVVSVTDDKGSCTTYAQVPSVGLANMDAWYCGNVIAGATTWTITWNNSLARSGEYAYIQLSGAETSSIVDAKASASPASGTTLSGAQVTTTFNNTLVTSVLFLDSGTGNVNGLHSGNSFTVSGLDDRGSGAGLDNGGCCGTGVAYQIVSGCSTVQPQWDLSAANSAESITVAWKQLGATTCGGGGSTFPPAGIGPLFLGCCRLPFDVPKVRH